MKRLGIGFFCAFLALNFACAGLLYWLSGSTPKIEGEIALQGLTEPASVTRDAHGVPHIKAASREDAYFALGFAHAQDRLWQMEAMRRIGAGRMAELVGKLSASAGKAALTFDRMTRGLGLYRNAEDAYRRASPELKLALEHYAAGVNAYLTTHEGALPPEFVLLFDDPEPWKPADSLVWQQLMALQLGTDWSRELLRLRMAEAGLTREQIGFLFQEPGSTSAKAEPVRESRVAPDLLDSGLRFAANLPALLAPSGASNAWALSGTRTVSGMPLLANDPHLALSNPNLWYLARIETPEGTLAGATVPGTPFMVLGHNGHIAWGFTTPYADSQDLFVERVDPADPARYLTPDGSQAFDLREETFHVGSEEVTERFRSTRHGPVISDLWSRAKRTDDTSVLALSAASLKPGDRTAEALLRLNRATSVADARAALQEFDSPAQNIMLADDGGDIALMLAGRLPRRGQSDGYMPSDGASGKDDWDGWIERTQLPLRLDPQSGELVQANDKLAPADPALVLGKSYEAPYRADRIRLLLDKVETGATVAQQRAIQLDTLSPEATAMVNLLAAHLGTGTLSEAATTALATLKEWDGEMRRDRVAPSIYTLWTELLHRRIFGDELGHLISEFDRVTPGLFKAVLTTDTGWCDDIRSPAVEPCEMQVRESLEEAVARLGTKYGKNQANWQWGRMHEAVFHHLLWSRVPFLEKVLGRKVPTDGGDYTVNRGSPRVKITANDFSFDHVHGAGLRAVYDLSDLDRSIFSLAFGQSGNPFSEFYQDLTKDWADGVYAPLGPDAGPGAKTLTLRPQ